jgi:D-alanyl-D-alanine carboxypeptidase
VGKKTMRTHNSLLVSFPGADGMKTGFICESGFNVVVSATRGGRKLVAVVLGEPSVASRNDRAPLPRLKQRLSPAGMNVGERTGGG